MPLLVAGQDVTEPILGYNVIEHLILNGSADQRILLESSLHCKKDGGIESLVALIQQKYSDSDFLTEVKTTCAVCVPAGHHVQIKCHVKTPGDDKLYISLLSCLKVRMN